jgi:hypothetical protein
VRGKMLIEKSYDNLEIMKLAQGGKTFYLGSKYNMQREIENFRKNFDEVNKNYCVIIFGSSGGRWIKEFEAEFKDREIIFVEPLDELKDNLDKDISEFNLKLKTLSMENEEFKKYLKGYITKRFAQFIVFSNYDMVFPNEVYNLKEIIKDIVIDKTINENTRIVFSKDWFENYLSNLPHLLTSEVLNQYKDSYKSKPAIIVSAGPSLEKNIRLLKNNEDKFIIITGIRTLKTLEKEGIKGDFACIIDGSEEMYKVSKESLNDMTPLFFSEGANRKVINEYFGKKIYFTSPTFYNLSSILGEYKTDLLFQGGSVAHSCTAIAHYLGCDPIVFIGQDLAYTNNQYHAKSATIDGEKLEVNKNDIYIKDIYGNDIATSYSLDAFRISFEDFIEQNNDRVYINATEGGANIKGTHISTLKEVIDHIKEKVDKEYISEYKTKINDVNIVIRNLKEIINELSKIKKFAKDAVEENKSLLDKFKKNNKEYKKSLNRLDYIDKKVGDKQKEFLLINTLFAPILKEIDIAFYDEQIGNFKDEIEHIKFVAKKGEVLYDNIYITINFAIPYINETIEKLEAVLNE